MHIQEDVNKGLKRAYLIAVSQEEVEVARTKRLQGIAKTAKIQGFRPGKAPLSVVRQRFGEEINGEVIEGLIDDGARKVLSDFSLRPAVRPQVNLVPGEEGKGFSFKMELEVLPEIKVTDFSKLSLERKTADVEPKTIDEALERVASSTQKTEPVTEPRPVAKGDVAVIDFDGAVDGQAREDMAAKGHQVKLGSGSLIDTFEEQIEGMKVGEEKTIKVTFPKDYGAQELAGKKAVFKVVLQGIKAVQEVVRDDAWAKEIGFPSLDKLRERIGDDIGKNYTQLSRTILKRDLMDKLADGHKFDLPESMVAQEFDSIWKQILQEKAQGRLGEDDAKKSEAELEKEYRDIAARRVRLGLLLAHVAEDNKIAVTQAELRDAMVAEARRYPGREAEVLNYFNKTPGAVDRMRAPILEEKVIDFIVGKAKVTDKKVSSEALIKAANEE